MNIVILTEGPFPYGTASTNRLVTYAKGMTEAGSRVSIICIKPSELEGKQSRNVLAEGNFHGISFKYTSHTTIRPKSALRRLRLYISGFNQGKKELNQMLKESPVDVLFMGLSNIWFTWSFYQWTRRNNVLFVQERGEYPFIGISGAWKKFNLWLYLRFTCKLFDALVVITRALEEYYSQYLRKDARTYLLPMLVESDRFKSLSTKPAELPHKYIAYVGSMQGSKDGVPILIESFAKVSSDNPDVHLVLIGDTKFDGFDLLSGMVENLGIRDRIHFTGRIEREKLPAYLEWASYLALARPNNKQAEGGFPTKLGEYLATGKPVIITAVGEITKYLTDGKNAYVSVPDDSNAFAEKLREALNNPERSKEIGEEGRKLIRKFFQPESQAKRMIDFFKEMKGL